MISSWILGAICVVIFFLLLKVFKVIEFSQRVLVSVQLARTIITNPDLDDLARERAIQAESIKLFRYFFILLIGGAAAFLLPTAALWLVGLTGLVSFEDVITTMASWPFILVFSLLSLLCIWLYRRLS